jgi:hypothetical protein
MLTLTATQFKLLTTENPAWASTLIEPVEITGDASLTNSEITHLSPLLHFTQETSLKFKNCKSLLHAAGEVYSPITFENCGIQSISGLKLKARATFKKCYQLENPTGTFPGPVRFKKCGLKTTKGLVIEQGAQKGSTLVLENCQQLESLEGTFPGPVAVYNCSVKTTENLEIRANQDKSWENAYFKKCPALQNAEGVYASSILYNDCGIQKIRNLKIKESDNFGISARFYNCHNLEIAEGNFPGFVKFENCGIHTAENLEIKNAVATGTYIYKKAAFINCPNLKNIQPGFTKENTIFHQSDCRPLKYAAEEAVIQTLQTKLHLLSLKSLDGSEASDTKEIAEYLLNLHFYQNRTKEKNLNPYKTCKKLKKKFNFKPSYKLQNLIKKIPRLLYEQHTYNQIKWAENNVTKFKTNETVHVSPTVVMSHQNCWTGNKPTEQEIEKLRKLKEQNTLIVATVSDETEEGGNYIKLLLEPDFFENEDRYEIYVLAEELIKLPQVTQLKKEEYTNLMEDLEITPGLESLENLCKNTPLLRKRPTLETLNFLYRTSFNQEHGICFQTWLNSKQEIVYDLFTNHLSQPEKEELTREFNLTLKALELLKNGVKLELYTEHAETKELPEELSTEELNRITDTIEPMVRIQPNQQITQTEKNLLQIAILVAYNNYKKDGNFCLNHIAKALKTRVKEEKTTSAIRSIEMGMHLEQNWCPISNTVFIENTNQMDTKPWHLEWGFCPITNLTTRTLLKSLTNFEEIENLKKHLLNRWTSATLKQHTYLEENNKEAPISRKWKNKHLIQYPIERYISEKVNHKALQKISAILMIWDYWLENVASTGKNFHSALAKLIKVCAHHNYKLSVHETSKEIHSECPNVQTLLIPVNAHLATQVINLQELKTILDNYDSSTDISYLNPTPQKTYIDEENHILIIIEDKSNLPEPNEKLIAMEIQELLKA